MSYQTSVNPEDGSSRESPVLRKIQAGAEAGGAEDTDSVMVLNLKKGLQKLKTDGHLNTMSKRGRGWEEEEEDDDEMGMMGLDIPTRFGMSVNILPADNSNSSGS